MYVYVQNQPAALRTADTALTRTHTIHMPQHVKRIRARYYTYQSASGPRALHRSHKNEMCSKPHYKCHSHTPPPTTSQSPEESIIMLHIERVNIASSVTLRYVPGGYFCVIYQQFCGPDEHDHAILHGSELYVGLFVCVRLYVVKMVVGNVAKGSAVRESNTPR